MPDSPKLTSAYHGDVKRVNTTPMPHISPFLRALLNQGLADQGEFNGNSPIKGAGNPTPFLPNRPHLPLSQEEAFKGNPGAEAEAEAQQAEMMKAVIAAHLKRTFGL